MWLLRFHNGHEWVEWDFPFHPTYGALPFMHPWPDANLIPYGMDESRETELIFIEWSYVI